MGSKFEGECLAAHNEYRKKHGVQVLKYNKQLSAVAQKWAEHLARTNSFQHNGDRDFKGARVGENIAMKYSSSGDDFTGRQVTDQWYDEVKKYNFRSNNPGSGTGHFTQVVWRDSAEFGVGKSQDKDGKWRVVANYLPAGNMMGQYASNVYPVGGAPGSSKRDESSRESRPGLSGSLFGRSADSRSVGERDQGRPVYSSSRGSSTSVSRRVTTETVNGRTVTKTITTETTTAPDGSKSVRTTEEVSEGGGGMSGGLRNTFDGMSLGPPSQPLPSSVSGAYGARSTDKQAAQTMDQFVKEVLTVHNEYRRKHGRVGDLKSNAELNTLAQRWADKLASTGSLSHSNDRYEGQQLGENVATKWSSQGADYTGKEVTDQWYSENKKYDFRKGTFTQGTGHFTQVVWKGSMEIGVGKAHSRDGKVFVVCNYSPAGNVVGQFAQNVFPES